MAARAARRKRPERAAALAQGRSKPSLKALLAALTGADWKGQSALHLIKSCFDCQLPGVLLERGARRGAAAKTGEKREGRARRRALLRCAAAAKAEALEGEF